MLGRASRFFKTPKRLIRKFSEIAGRKGWLYSVSGPSGVGKTTIINQLIGSVPNLNKIVSFTTRPKRPGEVDGETYHYIGDDQFNKMSEDDAFLYEFLYSRHRYGFGISKQEMYDKLNSGISLLTDVDWSIVPELKKQTPNQCALFIMPPNLDALRDRLTARGDSIEEIERRMAYAQSMITNAHVCDVEIVNGDSPEQAAEEFMSIIRANQPS